jgi:anti-anti-sigma regulatory factor
MDMATMLLLLDCLEDAMKRNGDIKLAAIPEAARASLELTGIDRLFEVFDTSADAVGSYHPLPLHAAWQSVAAASADLPIENAA